MEHPVDAGAQCLDVAAYLRCVACELRAGIGDDIIPLLAFLVQRIVILRKRGGDKDLFS